MHLHRFSPDDAPALQRLIESDPGFAERTTGRAADAADAVNLLIERPPDAADEDKIVYGGRLGEELVVVLDVIQHWPQPNTAHIGLLLVDGRRQGTGIGRQALAALDDVSANWPWLRLWRISVLRSNAQAFGFWHRMGYTETGETRPYRDVDLQTDAVILTRTSRADRNVGAGSDQ